MKLFPLMTIAEDRSCSFQLQKFEMGLSAFKSAPLCQISDTSLWEEKQCSTFSCTCVDTTTGYSSDPPRQASKADKEKLKCSGTPCLDEYKKNTQLAGDNIANGMVDLPYIPTCTLSGYYHPVQNDPVTGGSFCTGPGGEYRVPVDENAPNAVTYCQTVWSKKLWMKQTDESK